MKTTPDWQFGSAAEPEHRAKKDLVSRNMLILAIINLILIGLAPLASLYLNVPGILAFRVMLFAMLFGMTLAFISLVIFLVSVLKSTPTAGTNTLIILAIGFLPAIVAIASIGIDAVQRPLIHDITTDTTDPPLFQEVVRLRAAGDNSVDYAGAVLASLQAQAYPDIRPIISRMNSDEALSEATQVVKDLQWEFINIDYEKGIIEAYDTSRTFGFIDDIIIRVRKEGNGSRIDIRSVSRVGKGDLGKNAERIRQFIATFRG